MVLKKLAHYFCGRSLEKHTQKTQRLIAEYEREAEAANDRIQRQAQEYERKISSLKARREADLKAYVAFLNEKLAIANSYLPQMALFQQAMFEGLEVWARYSVCKNQLNLLNAKLRHIVSLRKLLAAFEADLEHLSRQPEAQAWRSFITERKVRMSSPLVDRLVLNSEKSIDNDANDFKHEIQRIRSKLRSLNKEQSVLRSRKKQTESDLEPLKQEMTDQKRRIKDLYMSVRETWFELGKSVDTYCQSSESDSELANQWFRAMPEGDALKEIKKMIGLTRDWACTAQDHLSALHEQAKAATARINECHQTRNFANLDSEKRARSAAYESITVQKKRIGELREARQVLFGRRDEINGYVERIRLLHPDTSIQLVFDMFAADDTSVYWGAIGLQTRAIKNTKVPRNDSPGA